MVGALVIGGFKKTRRSTVISSEKELAKTFNELLVSIVPNLGTDTYNVSEVTTSDTNSLTSIIKKYKHHPSIAVIKIMWIR